MQPHVLRRILKDPASYLLPVAEPPHGANVGTHNGARQVGGAPAVGVARLAGRRGPLNLRGRNVG